MNRPWALTAALALLGAANTAQAQSAVQLYGVLDAWAGRSAASGGGDASSVLNNGGLQTSFWGVGGGEDIGGGNRVIFAIESYVQLDTGAGGRTPTDALFSRNAYVGLQGGYGEFKFGRLLNPLFVTTAQVNPFGGSIRFGPLLAQTWSTMMGRNVIGDTSWDNAVSWTSPDLRGAKVSLYTALGEGRDGGKSSARNDGATFSYVAGPLAAYLTAQRVRTGLGIVQPDVSAQRTVFAGGSYDFGVVKAFASWDTARGKAPDLKSTTGQLGAAIPVGGGHVQLSWARTRTSADSAAVRSADTLRHTGAVGYDYILSKRSDLYLVLQRDRVTGAGPAQSYGVGLRHRF